MKPTIPHHAVLALLDCYSQYGDLVIDVAPNLSDAVHIAALMGRRYIGVGDSRSEELANVMAFLDPFTDTLIDKSQWGNNWVQ